MADNKLIMKNTVFMAVRMFFSMGVTLYTSRVVLQQLGVDGFGIFTVVGGLAAIMAFFTSALTAAIQRYMNVELAVGEGRDMQQVFAACWGAVGAMALAFVVVAEVAGVWFVGHKLEIPPGHLGDAMAVLQISMLIVIIEMCRVPYNSLIIAHERMSFFAYNSILEVVLKLVTAVSLMLAPGNKLLIYMWLLVGVALLINGSYIVYCRRHFSSVRFSLRADRRRMVEIGKFAGWNVLTSLSDIAYQQGSNVIVNMFFGVTVNATMGVANQVKTAVSSFTRSVQLAANPQIIKTYASGEQAEFVTLVTRISRVSYLMVLLLGVPIILNTGYILSLWLTVIPPMAQTFVRLMVLYCIVDSLVGPLWVTMQACGRIAVYQIVISLVWLLCLPVTYLVFKAGCAPYWVLIVIVLIDFALIIVRVGFSSRYCNLGFAVYLKEVVLPLVAVTVASVILPGYVAVVSEPGLSMLLVTCGLWCVTMPVATWFIALTGTERDGVKNFVRKIYQKKSGIR